ncbi:hypothetical protein BASH2_02206 [Bacillus anthracis]|nr:hypothetical protein BASH2_02206 [Bacillus anthracis]
MVTLSGMKVVPLGVESISVTLVAGTVPPFRNVIVYVMVSPISASCLSAVLVGVEIIVLTAVSVLGVGLVFVTGGSLGFTI